ncbi:DUF7848 domain-containing protein [Streptomyces tauricus]
MPALRACQAGCAMTRATYRFIEHTIRHAPEGGVVFELCCVTCPETSGGQAVQVTAQDWALKHTAAHPEHDLFRREVTDFARVTRD